MDGKQFNETVALPPLGPPSSNGIEVLCPDLTITLRAPGDSVKSDSVTVSGTGALLEDMSLLPPWNVAVTCSEPAGICVAGMTAVPVAFRLPGFVKDVCISTDPNAKPLANRVTPPKIPMKFCAWLAVTVAVKVTTPELSTFAGVSDNVVVVGVAELATNV